MSPAFPVLDQPVELVLHIGTGKTGTTSLQHMLKENRARIAELGTLVPRSLGRTRHTRLGLAMRSGADLETQVSWHRQEAASPAQFRRRVLRRLAAEIEQSGAERVLVTDEALYGMPVDAMRRLRRLTDGLARRTRVVVYLRRQDDHLASRYQQVVKTGEVRRLVDRVSEMRLDGLYDYHARLQQWQHHLAPDELVVRRFERDAFLHGSLHQDYLDAVGIVAAPGVVVEPPRRNESLDAESAEFLRILNLYRVEHEGARAGVIDNREYLPRLATLPVGPTLTLPHQMLEEFMGRYETSNAAVARDFLGDADGVLFRSPGRTAGTTSEQYLDPDRVDQFLDVAEVPLAAHEPVRQIARREAAGWTPAD